MTIHHATKTKAAKLEIQLVELDDGTVTFEVDGVISPAYANGKEALEAAIEFQADDQPNVHDVEESEADEGDDDDTAPSSIVKAHYRAEYKARGDASTCGDELAYAIKDFVTSKNAKGKDELSLSDLRTLAVDNELEDRLDHKWAGLNPGQKRMNLGNMLRSRYKKGEAVQIGVSTWQLTQEQLEEAVAAAA